MRDPLRPPADRFAGAADDVYEALIRGHEGLGERESAALNARLILILANEVGDLATIEEAIRLARETSRSASPLPACGERSSSPRQRAPG